MDYQITPDDSQTPPQFQDPFSPGQLASVTITNGSSGYTGTRITLTFTGGGGTGAAGYAVVDPSSGAVVGVVMTNFGKNYTSAPTVHDTGHNTATYLATIGPQDGTFPSCTTYFQQRQAFAATLNFPESVVFSQPQNYTNFDTTPTALATDSITVSNLAGRQDDSIKSMVPMSTGLIMFTTGGAFLSVQWGNQSAAITPEDVSSLPQASSGANDLPPLPVNYDVLYVQNRGNTVRDLQFNFYVQSYMGTDRSMLASHLFLGYTLSSWTYAEEPFRLIPAVRNDGVLLVLTYVPEQDVVAWTHWDTNGNFLAVASVVEGQENAIYVIVERFGTHGNFYFLERFDNRLFNFVQDAWCLDAALPLPQTMPNANCTLSGGQVGELAIVTTDANVFDNTMVGDIIWGPYGGQLVINTYFSATRVTGTVLQAFPVLTDNALLQPQAMAAGTWSLDTPSATVSGLSYLEGFTVVSALIDGVPAAGLAVSNTGTVTLPTAGTKVIVGLPYQCQMQTLRLDTGDPTIQGKRKLEAAVTTRVDKATGLKVGISFGNMIPIKDLIPPYTPPLGTCEMATSRTVLPGRWEQKRPRSAIRWTTPCRPPSSPSSPKSPLEII